MEKVIKMTGKALVHTLLNDASTEDAALSSDRIAGLMSANATSVSQAVVRRRTVIHPPLDSLDDYSSCSQHFGSAYANPAKLILLRTGTMTTTQASLVELTKIDLPTAFYSNNACPAAGQTRYFTMIRTGYSFELQVNAAVGCVGAMLMYYVPAGVDTATLEPTALMMLPHCLINIGVMSSGTLDIPYTNLQNYISTTGDGELGSLRVMVWSKLGVPPAGTVLTELSYAVYGAMTDFDLQCPQPYTALAGQADEREKIDIAEGPGAMNLANFLTTSHGQLTALCGETTLTDAKTAGAGRPVTNLRELITQPLPFVTPFEPTKKEVGKVTYQWAATKNVGDLLVEVPVRLETTNKLLQFLTHAYCYWRGSIVLTVTVFGTPLVKGRMRICWFPNRTEKFTSAEANNSIYTVFDIGLQTSVDMVLPYIWYNRLRKCRSYGAGVKKKAAVEHDENKLGYLQIFVANRLSAPSTTAGTIEFSLFFRAGEDFYFVAPTSTGIVYQGDTAADMLVGGAGQQDAVASGLTTIENTQPEEMEARQPTNLNSTAVFVPIIKADHMDFNAMMARSQEVLLITYVAPTKRAAAAPRKEVLPLPDQGYAALLKLFAYWSGELNVHIYNQSAAPVIFSHTFSSEVGATRASVTAHGAVVIPCNSFITINVPFYSEYPVRGVRPWKYGLASAEHSPLGWLLMENMAAGHARVWVSFRDINLFFPLPPPLPKAVSEAVKELKDASAYRPYVHEVLDALEDESIGLDDILDVQVCPPEDIVKGMLEDRYKNNSAMQTKLATIFGEAPASWVSKLNEFQQRTGASINQECESFGPDHDKTFEIRYIVDGVPFPKGRGKSKRDAREIAARNVLEILDPGPFVSKSLLSLEQKMMLEKIEFMTQGIEDRVAGMGVQIEGFWKFVRENLDVFQGEYMQETLKSFRQACTQWIRDLTTEGIEPNPGPRSELVFRDRGLYRHYGVRMHGMVIHMNSENILDTAIQGKVGMCVVRDSGEWHHEQSVDISDVMARAITQSATHTSYFSGDNNCETWAHKMLGIEKMSQSRALAIFGIIIATTTGLFVCGEGLADQLKGAAKSVGDTFSDFKETAASNFRALLVDSTLNAIKDDMVKGVAKMLIRTICYGILFCSSPGVLSGVAVASLVAMDLAAIDGLGQATKDLVSALLDGDLDGMVEAVVGLVHQNRDDRPALVRAAAGQMRDMCNEIKSAVIGQAGDNPFIPAGSLRDNTRKFNEFSLAAKNMEYWLSIAQRFLAWLKGWICPNRAQDAEEWLSQHGDKALGLLMEVDAIILDAKKPGKNRETKFHERVTSASKKLGALRVVALRARHYQLLNTVNQLSNRLGMVPLPPINPPNLMRVEPIGIWISGDAGCGKSTLTTTLMAGLAEELEKRSKVNTDLAESGADKPYSVFPHPTGSQYYDGYSGQFFHTIDDLAQATDQEDLRLVCQTISSVPFSVPMADLNEKGTKYTSKIVIATTNQTDFATHVLSSPEAYERRFPHKLWVSVAPPYQSTTSGKVRINLPLAERGLDNKGEAMDKGEPWMVSYTGVMGAKKPLDLPELVRKIAGNYETRVRVMAKLNQRLKKFQLGMASDTVPVKVGAEIDELGGWADFQGATASASSSSILGGIPIVGQAGEDKVEMFDIIKLYDDMTSQDPVVMKTIEEAANVDFDDAILELNSIGVMEQETPFESLREKVVAYSPITEKVRKWWDSRNKVWKTRLSEMAKYAGLVTAVGTVVGTICALYVTLGYKAHAARLESKLYGKINDNLEGVVADVREAIDETFPDTLMEEQRAYSGPKMTNMKSKKVVLSTVSGQSPQMNQEYAHIMANCGYFTLETGGVAYCFGIGGKTFVTYKHFIDAGGRINGLVLNGIHHPIDFTVYEEDSSLTSNVYYETEEGHAVQSDLLYIQVPNYPRRCKPLVQHIADAMPRRSGVLLWATKGGNFGLGVENIQLERDTAMMLDKFDGERMKQRAHISPVGYTYQVRNSKGMCGGVLIQKQNGAWKIVGMHHAGDGILLGVALKIHALEAQGVVTSVSPAPFPHFTPTKSAIQKSPLYGVVPTTKGPAPLHPRDPRVLVPIDNLVKKSSGKYRVDVFEPPESAFNAAQLFTTQQLFSVTGRRGLWSIVDALNGGPAGNKVEMHTSPGLKYTQQNKKKTDLVIQKDGILYPTSEFEADVLEALEAIREGKGRTIFAGTLKDEVISQEKIEKGGTRCIEACDFDYVVAHRMVLGELFQDIYESASTRTGVAVGINPYVDFHHLFHAMRDNWYAVDYSAYDGSLSEGLMRAGVEVLASCHEDPILVQNLLEPVVMSTHHIADEIWEVKGGMPSGSPCTSVLNSVCNLLVIRTCLVDLGVDLGSHTIVTYGDDVLFSTDEMFDDQQMVERIGKYFGMTATSADKTSRTLSVHPSDATFLKRTFCFFPDTRYITGALDLDAMLQKIQWCHGFDEFKQQLESFTQELVLHGVDKYNEIAQKLKPRLDKYKVFVPTYKQRRIEVFNYFFE